MGDKLAHTSLIFKQLAQGFVFTALALGLFNVVVLVANDRVWLGLLSLTVLLIPLSATIYLFKRRNKKTKLGLSENEKIARILFALQGVALACWSFDNTTTFYAIDVARVATELNPLGWPLGAIGALVYYIPTMVATYMLIFKINNKTTTYAAMGITAVTLYMGCLNMNAGINNYMLFYTFAPYSIPIELQNKLIFTMITVDLVYALSFAVVKKSSSVFCDSLAR